MTGDELLKIALDKVAQAVMIIGGKVVYLECDASPKLLEFYARHGFITFGERPKSSEDYDQMEGAYLVQLLKVLK